MVRVTLATLFDDQEGASVEFYNLRRDVFRLAIAGVGRGDLMEQEVRMLVESELRSVAARKFPGRAYARPEKLLSNVWPRLFAGFQPSYLSDRVSGGAEILRFA
jgi:hypothetical protein